MSGEAMGFSDEELERLAEDDREAVSVVSTRIMLDALLLVARAYALGVGGVSAALPAASPDVPSRTRLMIAGALRNVCEGLLDGQEDAARQSGTTSGQQLRAACERLGLPVETVHDWHDTGGGEPTPDKA